MPNFSEYITVNPDIWGGKPCIKGTRIAVYDVLDYLAGGMSQEEILEDFLSLKAEHILAVLAFAATKERRFLLGDYHENAA